MSPRYASNRDSNEPEIIEVLRAVGWGVYPVNHNPHFPDLVVGRGDEYKLIEVVSPTKWSHNISRGGLSEGQEKFRDGWPATIHVVRSVDEALAVVSATRNKDWSTHDR